MNSPCYSLRQYRDRDQDRQNDADAELEAARQEADSFSFGPRHKFTNTRLESEMSDKDVVCNSPWVRVPQHAYDPGYGPVPPIPKVVQLFGGNEPCCGEPAKCEKDCYLKGK